MKIDDQLISKLEHLTRLELQAEERENLQKDLNNILGMVEKLQELDLSDVEPLIYVSQEVNVLREDEVKHQLTQAEALLNAPDKTETHFKVPKVIG